MTRLILFTRFSIRNALCCVWEMDKLPSALERLGGIELNKEQHRAVQEVFQSCRAGTGVFVTGQAGTGKSTLLQVIVKMLELGDTPFQVTASTGIAALNVGGVTLHSFLGCGLALEDKDTLVEKLYQKHNRYKLTTLRRLRVLIIDEVSMVLPDFFEKMDHILRQARSYQSSRPFGGLRVIMFGDFYQLPPVHKGEPRSGEHFCNQTTAWSTLHPSVVELTQQVRQEGDVEFAALLGRMRIGEMTPEDHDRIEQRIGADIVLPEGVEPTRLYAKNVDVDALNRKMLLQLSHPRTRYHVTSWTTGGCSEKQAAYFRKGLLSSLPVSVSLEICEGAQVMFCANMLRGMVANGSRGVVVGFDYPSSDVVDSSLVTTVEENEGRKMDVQKRFDVAELFDETTRFQFIPGVQHPIVRFRTPEGLPNELMVPFASWHRVISRSGSGAAKAVWACQIPLRLAWAITIHKSQGCTIDAAVLSTGDVFAPGQTYVAFSRARSLDTVTVRDYDREKVFVHPCLQPHCPDASDTNSAPPSRKRPRPLPTDDSAQLTCDAFFGAVSRDDGAAE